MKKILGSIFAVILLTTTVFAGAKAYVDKSAIYAGDNISFTISVDGKNPTFPEITSIGPYSVLGVSSSKSVNITNGNYQSTTSKSYEFAPTKSLMIPSFKVKSDGKTYNTAPIAIKVLKPSASKPGDEVSLSIVADKSKVYVGEPIKLAVKVKYKLNANIDKISISEPKIDNFWIKKNDKPVQSMSGDMVIQTYKYLIFPQKSGNFKINQITANIGKVSRTNTGGNIGGNFFNDPFFNAFNSQIRWKKIFSNDLNISVKPLPNNLDVYGAFNISASVDRNETLANKPVNLTIKIKGIGNIDDIRKFSIDLPDVVEYSDDPSIKTGMIGGKYGGVFTQKVALIADKDFVIPALKFNYFDKDHKLAVTKTTRPISIKVKGGGVLVQTPKVDTAPQVMQVSSQAPIPPHQQATEGSVYLKYLFLVIGLILGVVGTLITSKIGKKAKNKNKMSIILKIKRAKGDKELFYVLLPNQKADDFINAIVEKLEENIYRNGQHKISKKEIIEHFLELEL